MATVRKPKRMTPEAIAANRANAKKPRGKAPSPPMADEITDAKEQIGRPALRRCLQLWADILDGKVKRQVVTEAGIFDADPTIEQRIAASREIANRCGLPVRTDVDMSTAPPFFRAIEGFAEDPPGSK